MQKQSNNAAVWLKHNRLKEHKLLKKLQVYFRMLSICLLYRCIKQVSNFVVVWETLTVIFIHFSVLETGHVGQ